MQVSDIIAIDDIMDCITRLFNIENKIWDQNKISDCNEKIKKIFKRLKKNTIETKCQDYRFDIQNILYFSESHSSATVTYTMEKKNNIKYLLKLFPMKLPYIPEKIVKNNNILLFLSFMKEIWLWEQCNNKIMKYTPVFPQMIAYHILDNCPFKMNEIINSLDNVRNPPQKLWLDAITEFKIDLDEKRKVIESQFGCIELSNVDGMLYEYLNEPNKINLSLFFEYIYARIVLYKICNVVLLDYTFEEMGYVNVKYPRCYNITANGLLYKFTMPAGIMIQFTELQKYCIGEKKNDLYTDILKIDKNINKQMFENSEEYEILMNILKEPHINNIKEFVKIMHQNLPNSYTKSKIDCSHASYHINLDNNNY